MNRWIKWRYNHQVKIPVLFIGFQGGPAEIVFVTSQQTMMKLWAFVILKESLP